MSKDSTHGGAEFSADKLHRTSLWRRWAAGPRVLWICLNPSTAGAREEDHSTRKIRVFSENAGFGGYDLMNLFSYRSTNPYALKGEPLDKLSPPRSVELLVLAARKSPMIVCAWGNHGKLYKQDERVLEALSKAGQQDKLYALKVNADGSPAHPLMLSYEHKFTRFIF